MSVYIHVREQNVSCAHAVIEHFTKLTIVFFYESVLLMSHFFLKFCHSFG